MKNNTAGSAAEPGCGQSHQVDGWTPWFHNSDLLKPHFPINKKLLLEIISPWLYFIHKGNIRKDLDSAMAIPRLSATIWYCMRICIKNKEKGDEGAQKPRDGFNNGSVERQWMHQMGRGSVFHLLKVSIVFGLGVPGSILTTRNYSSGPLPLLPTLWFVECWISSARKFQTLLLRGWRCFAIKEGLFFFLFDSTPSLFISRLIASLQSLLLHRTASPHLEQPLLCNISFEPKPEIQKGRREAAAPGGWEHCGFSIKCYFSRFTAACV